MPTAERAIYLHIGPAKTGTTYLQDVLWGNRRELVRQGLTFPGKRPGDHFHAALDLRGIQFGGYDNPDTEQAWRRLVTASHRVRTPAVVISHEIFAGASDSDVDRLARELADRPLHVVIGARDLARQLPAVWQESLKNRRSRTFDEFLALAIRARRRGNLRRGFWRSQDTSAVLSRWARVLPPSRIHVVTLPQAGAPADTLWSRFAAVIGVAPARFDLGVARPNASLGSADAELLRRLNQELPDDLPWPAYERSVKRRFNALANERLAGDRVRVPAAHRDWLLEEAARTTEALQAARYDIMGDLADLVPADGSFAPASAAAAAPASVTDADVAALVASVLGARGGRIG